MQPQTCRLGLPELSPLKNGRLCRCCSGEVKMSKFISAYVLTLPTKQFADFRVKTNQNDDFYVFFYLSSKKCIDDFFYVGVISYYKYLKFLVGFNKIFISAYTFIRTSTSMLRSLTEHFTILELQNVTFGNLETSFAALKLPNVQSGIGSAMHPAALRVKKNVSGAIYQPDKYHVI